MNQYLNKIVIAVEDYLRHLWLALIGRAAKDSRNLHATISEVYFNYLNAVDEAQKAATKAVEKKAVKKTVKKAPAKKTSGK